MSFDVARSMIAQAWKDEWDAGPLADMPVEFQNQGFDRPANIAWGRYTLLTGDTEPAALGTPGSRFERTPFVLTLQVFNPEDKGTRPAYQAADVMKNLNYQVLRNPDGLVVVHFRTAGLTPGVAEDGFDAFNVTIRGSFDTYASAS